MIARLRSLDWRASLLWVIARCAGATPAQIREFERQKEIASLEAQIMACRDYAKRCEQRLEYLRQAPIAARVQTLRENGLL